MQIALEYIEQHRAQLTEDLKEILPQKAERERYYRALEAEIQKKIDELPMTPERAAFYALREKIDGYEASMVRYIILRDENYSLQPSVRPKLA